nr:MAG TPA: hypothetical protein [Caudoviricetes sp.]
MAHSGTVEMLNMTASPWGGCRTCWRTHLTHPTGGLKRRSHERK